MKHLAIDFGKKRLGLAISDEGARVAVPYEVRERRGLKKDVRGLVETLRTQHIGRVVLGLPHHAEGEGVHHAEVLRALADALQNSLHEAELPIEIAWWDERFSTAEAWRGLRAMGISTRHGKSDIDAHAAAVILQGYLDAQQQKLHQQHSTAVDGPGDQTNQSTNNDEDDAWLN